MFSLLRLREQIRRRIEEDVAEVKGADQAEGIGGCLVC